MSFLVRIDVVEWNVSVIRVLINQHCMALRESSSTNILSTYPHIEPCLQIILLEDYKDNNAFIWIPS
jgi:hypothetical protein